MYVSMACFCLLQTMRFISHVTNQICSLICVNNVDTPTIIIIEAAGAQCVHFTILLWRFGNYECNTIMEKIYNGQEQTI